MPYTNTKSLLSVTLTNPKRNSNPKPYMLVAVPGATLSKVNGSLQHTYTLYSAYDYIII